MLYFNTCYFITIFTKDSSESKKSSFCVITVRAHLEQFEELLRMGVWDFMINMSGSDLSIRSASWIYVWFDFLL